MSKPLNYAWDTSVLLAWLREETSAPLEDIALVVQEIDNGRANLIFPVTVFVEILETRHKASSLEKLNLFLKRSNVVKVDTTFPIAQRASKIRDQGEREKRKIKTPDATIVATALLAKADVLHSLDDKILALNGSPLVEGLLISKPALLVGDAGMLN